MKRDCKTQRLATEPTLGLPTSILLLTFVMVDWRALVLSVSRVCVAWKLALKEISTLMNVPCLFAQEFLAAMRVLGAGFQHLTLDVSTGRVQTEDLASALSRCCRLKKLVVQRGFWRPSLMLLLDALAAPSLASLRYSGDLCSFSWTNSKTTGLLRLSLHRVILPRGALDMLPHLKSLKLDDCNTEQFALPRGLVKLSLNRVPRIKDVDLAGLSSLKELILGAYVETPLSTFCQGGSRLERLRARRRDLEGFGCDLDGLALELKRIRPSLKAISLEMAGPFEVTLLSLDKEFM